MKIFLICVLLLTTTPLLAQTPKEYGEQRPKNRKRSKQPGGERQFATVAGVEHLTFHSTAYGTERNFSIWLPESYNNSDRRYPVLYWLHGKGGHPQRSSHLAKYLKEAIEQGIIPETIMVFPDGDKDRFYTDDLAGASPVETMIISELIPYIDTNYRTIASREGRMIEGFSMGGFGALKFAGKYPEMFASVVACGAPRLDAELGMRANDADIYESVFDNSKDRFRENTPSWLFEVNKERILSSGMMIRLVAGTEDGTRHSVEKFHQTLDKLGIAHEYVVLEGVRHGADMYYQKENGAGFALHAKSLNKN